MASETFYRLAADVLLVSHALIAAFLIFGLVTWSLAAGFFPEEYPGLPTAAYWFLGAVTSLLFFGSVLMHELAHAYHDQILSFDNPDVLAAYKRCVEGTAYPERDWVKSNHKEFFAGVTTR